MAAPLSWFADGSHFSQTPRSLLGRLSSRQYYSALFATPTQRACAQGCSHDGATQPPARRRRRGNTHSRVLSVSFSSFLFLLFARGFRFGYFLALSAFLSHRGPGGVSPFLPCSLLSWPLYLLQLLPPPPPSQPISQCRCSAANPRARGRATAHIAPAVRNPAPKATRENELQPGN